MPAADLYPTSPANVPLDLTAPSRSYKIRVIIVLVSLIAFVALYFAMIVGTAYFSYWSFTQIGGEPRPVPFNTRGTRGRSPVRYERTDDQNGWWAVPGIASAVMCLFLVKGFFKRQRVDPSLHVEIGEDEAPELYAFIRRLCQETRAPLPRKIFLSPEVNASVFYHSSFLNLFLPAHKNLLIGLGLVNRLNLSEIKAVLAHEFGHFSQSSMKLGTYVYTSNRIIVELVYGRDWLDDVVAFLGRIDIRIAIFAWGFAGILWGVRKGLEQLYKGINFANLALSRQMEFNADLVAVSVAGSDAGVNGLARTEFANEALMQAWHDLSAAADHKMYTRDLFYHQTRAAEFLKVQRKNPKLGESPPLPDDPTQKTQVFQPGDEGVPSMWASHPSNYDREQNAKRVYIRVPLDERPAWVLFSRAEDVREKVTRRFYEVVKETKTWEPADPGQVQAFIDAEHAETTYPEHYYGMYDDRYVLPGKLDELVQAAPAQFADAASLSARHAALYTEEVKKRMEGYQEHRREEYLLSGLVSGSLSVKGKDFPFREKRYRAADAPRLLKKVEADLKADQDWLNEVDRQVFALHYAMAHRMQDESAAELESRYRFHLSLQEILSHLIAYQSHIQEVLGRIAGQRQVPQELFQSTVASLRQARETFEEKLNDCEKLFLPAMKHMTAGASLREFLLDEPLVRPLRASVNSLNGEWIGKFMNQLNAVIVKMRRIHYKSLGGILSLQENVAQKWHSGNAPVPGTETLSCPNPASGLLSSSSDS
jgi:Zn-dependent protease with chaperone function